MPKILAADLEIEYPPPDNIRGEHMRHSCDVTHLPSGIRVRGRGNTPEVAKIAAIARLKVEFGYNIHVPTEQRHVFIPAKNINPEPDGVE